MTSTLLTSPVGDIWYMAANEPRLNAKTGKSKREITLLLDSKEAAEFISAVKKVNKGIPVTEHTYSGDDENLRAALAGKTKVTAGTQFEVKVYSAEKLQALKDDEPISLAELEEIPNFFTGDVGRAQMVVQPYTKSEKGGTINLVSIVIHSIESSGTGAVDKETKLAQLRDAMLLNIAKKG